MNEKQAASVGGFFYFKTENMKKCNEFLNNKKFKKKRIFVVIDAYFNLFTIFKFMYTGTCCSAKP